MDITQIAAVATEIAQARSFTYDSNQGTKDAFTYTVKIAVDVATGTVTLRAETNFQIRADRAKAELRAVMNELSARLLAHDPKFPAGRVKVRGAYVWSYGFWHMGRWDVSGYSCGLRMKAAEKAA